MEKALLMASSIAQILEVSVGQDYLGTLLLLHAIL